MDEKEKYEYDRVFSIGLTLERQLAAAKAEIKRLRPDAERFNQLLDIPALQDELCWLFEIRSCDEDNLSILKAKIVAAIDAAREVD